MAKKKEAHHGGAWKVAFADFMTAMMALFLVLWISAQDKEILIATSQYFQNPFNSPMDRSSGVMPFNSNKNSNGSSSETGAGKMNDSNKQIEVVFLNSVAADFMRLLHLDENLADKPIEIQVTSDGLRVNLFDRPQKPLFVKDTTQFTEWGAFAMQSLAWMIDRHHFRVTIDGHTRRQSAEKTGDYTAWELSADRANAARRSLVRYAVDEGNIERVTGYASTRPLPNEKPDAEANERITLSLTFAPKDPKNPPAAPSASPPAENSNASPLLSDQKSPP